MVRKSNIELMRIILFTMVLAIHISAQYLNTIHYVGSVNWQFANFLDGFSRIAVLCFALISGYFMCVQKNHTMKSVKSLLIPLSCYLLPYYFLYISRGNGFIKSIFVLIRDLLVNTKYFYHMWYIPVILVVYVLSGFFNHCINSVSKKEFEKLLKTLFVLFFCIVSINFIIGYRLIDTTLFSSRLGIFSTMYFFGAYIRLYAVVPKKPLKLFAIFLALNLLVVLISAFYNSRYSPLFLFSFLKNTEITYPFDSFVGGTLDISFVPVFIAAVAFFIFILSLDFQSKIINFISKRTYGAYIIHIFWISVFSDHAPSIDPYMNNESPYYPLFCIVAIVVIGILSILSAIIFDYFLIAVKKLYINNKHYRLKARR